MPHQLAYSTDRDTLYRNLDPQSPDRFLLTSNEPDAKGMVTCFVHVQKDVRSGRVYAAIGRTTRYQLQRLQSTKHFVPVTRPFVICRDDGHEVSFG